MKRLVRTEKERKEAIFIKVFVVLMIIKCGYPLLKQAIYYLFN